MPKRNVLRIEGRPKSIIGLQPLKLVYLKECTLWFQHSFEKHINTLITYKNVKKQQESVKGPSTLVLIQTCLNSLLNMFKISIMTTLVIFLSSFSFHTLSRNFRKPY